MQKQDLNTLISYCFIPDDVDRIHYLMEQERFNSIRSLISHKKSDYENKIHYITAKSKEDGRKAMRILDILDEVEDYFINKVEQAQDDERRIQEST